MLSFRLKRFLIFFIPLVLITTAVSLNLYLTSLEADRQRLQSEQSTLVAYQKESLEKVMNAFMSELMVLTSHHILQVWLKSGNDRELKYLANEFRAFSEHKGIYDQARIIDLQGNEIIRVNWNRGTSEIVPAEQLQNKGDRYYFKETLALNRGEFYVSPFDLNIEQGEIEQPLKPVIRLATPMVDEQGNKRGIIILSLIGTEILERLDPIHAGFIGQTMLINADGYWLKGLSSDDEWGFMLPDRSQKTFQSRFPDAARLMKGADDGVISLDSGLFAYATVAAHPSLEGHVIKSQAMQQPWRIVSFISPAALDMASSALRERFLLFNAVFALLFAIGSWIGADSMNRHHLAEKQLRVSERRFRSVAETARDAIIITDEEGEIISWNGGAEFIFGFAESEVLGGSMTLIIPERYHEMYREGLRHHKQTGASTIMEKSMEMHGLRKDGKEIDIRFSPSSWEADGEHFYGAIIHDITATKNLERQLEAMASKDGLTGLYNRATFDTRIVEELSRAGRYKHPISIMFLDIDYFKKVNDNYGHAAGDACLIEFAALMRKMTRNVDVVARYGGEEFVIILPHTDSKSANILAERLREAAEQMSTVYKNEHISWTISIGLASLEQNWNVSIESWLERADGALYKAKESGRNRVVTSQEEHA